MSRTLPNMGLEAFFAIGEDGWDDEMSLNLLKLSVLAQGGAASLESALPGSPAEGDVYVLDETATGNENQIAIRDDGAWVFVDPLEGWQIYDRAGDVMLRFDGAVWGPAAGGSASYPDFTGNATKHLAVNGAEDGVEWVDGEAGGGGGGDPAPTDIFHIQHREPTSTDGGAHTAGSDHKRKINTVVTNTVAGASLDGGTNQFILPAGTYDIEGGATFYRTDRSRCWLYNVTDSEVTLLGESGLSDNSTDGDVIRSVIRGRIVLAAPKTFELRSRSSTSSATNGAGVHSGFAGEEVYAEVWASKQVASTLKTPDILADFDFAATPEKDMEVGLQGFNKVMVVYTGVTAPSGAYGIRLSNDDGVSFHATSGDYIQQAVTDNAKTQNGDDTMIRFGFGAASNVNGQVELSNLSLAGAVPCSHGMGSRETASTGISQYVMPGERGPFTHMQITAGANFTAGRMQVIGIS